MAMTDWRDDLAACICMHLRNNHDSWDHGFDHGRPNLAHTSGIVVEWASNTQVGVRKRWANGQQALNGPLVIEGEAAIAIHAAIDAWIAEEERRRLQAREGEAHAIIAELNAAVKGAEAIYGPCAEPDQGPIQ